MIDDVVIFSEGMASRLAGIWEHSKCLVPVAGRALLLRLLDALVPLDPKQIILTGHRMKSVTEWMVRAAQNGEKHPLFLRMIVLDEPRQLGTAGALRACAKRVHAPLLALNGDTMPLYSLSAFVGLATKEKVMPDTSTIALRRDRYAGAAVIGTQLMEVIMKERHETSLDVFFHTPSKYLYPFRVDVPGFLDVGTPEGFYLAQQWSENDLNQNAL